MARLFASAAAIAVCAACSASSPPTNATFGTTPVGVQTTTSGAYVVTIYPPMGGLVRGLNTIEIVVTGAQSAAPVDNLTIDVVPWMPAMGHGASATPLVSAMGTGVYIASDVSLFMPGTWQLRTSVTSTDAVIVTVDIL